MPPLGLHEALQVADEIVDRLDDAHYFHDVGLVPRAVAEVGADRDTDFVAMPENGGAQAGQLRLAFPQIRCSLAEEGVTLPLEQRRHVGVGHVRGGRNGFATCVGSRAEHALARHRISRLEVSHG